MQRPDKVELRRKRRLIHAPVLRVNRAVVHIVLLDPQRIPVLEALFTVIDILRRGQTPHHFHKVVHKRIAKHLRKHHNTLEPKKIPQILRTRTIVLRNPELVVPENHRKHHNRIHNKLNTMARIRVEIINGLIHNVALHNRARLALDLPTNHLLEKQTHTVANMLRVPLPRPCQRIKQDSLKHLQADTHNVQQRKEHKITLRSHANQELNHRMRGHNQRADHRIFCRTVHNLVNTQLDKVQNHHRRIGIVCKERRVRELNHMHKQGRQQKRHKKGMRALRIHTSSVDAHLMLKDLHRHRLVVRAVKHTFAGHGHRNDLHLHLRQHLLRAAIGQKHNIHPVHPDKPNNHIRHPKTPALCALQIVLRHNLTCGSRRNTAEQPHKIGQRNSNSNHKETRKRDSNKWRTQREQHCLEVELGLLAEPSDLDHKLGNHNRDKNNRDHHQAKTNIEHHICDQIKHKAIQHIEILHRHHVEPQSVRHRPSRIRGQRRIPARGPSNKRRIGVLDSIARKPPPGEQQINLDDISLLFALLVIPDLHRHIARHIDAVRRARIAAHNNGHLKRHISESPRVLVLCNRLGTARKEEQRCSSIKLKPARIRLVAITQILLKRTHRRHIARVGDPSHKRLVRENRNRLVLRVQCAVLVLKHRHNRNPRIIALAARKVRQIIERTDRLIAPEQRRIRELNIGRRALIQIGHIGKLNRNPGVHGREVERQRRRRCTIHQRHKARAFLKVGLERLHRRHRHGRRQTVRNPKELRRQQLDLRPHNVVHNIRVHQIQRKLALARHIRRRKCKRQRNHRRVLREEHNLEMLAIDHVVGKPRKVVSELHIPKRRRNRDDRAIRIRGRLQRPESRRRRRTRHNQRHKRDKIVILATRRRRRRRQ
eukprot:comp22230_c0_seq1/m.52646 comp22230_c0_seq1/g.52646  ORF comp22230_c0_seq1/g.52646 comp22230_c0_seq1/m.52646 type:complete len:881 (-) comp22230_c0_seq1:471-3113(-)